MLHLHSFSAWITADGKELPTYSVECSEEKRIATGWIASEEGKNFIINWRDIDRAEDSIGRTTVDGVKCGTGKGLQRRGYRTDGGPEKETTRQVGIATSSSTDRLFMFSRLELTDDDLYLDSPTSSELGEIKLQIWTAQRGRTTELKVSPFQEVDKVHERAKRVFARHQTKLGHEVQGLNKRTYTVKTSGDPWTFIFRYRPSDILRANGIIKDPRKFRPIVDKQDVIDLTVEDESVEPKGHDSDKRAKRLPPLKVEAICDEDSKSHLVRVKMEEDGLVVKREIKSEMMLSGKFDWSKLEDDVKDEKPARGLHSVHGVKSEASLEGVKLKIEKKPIYLEEVGISELAGGSSSSRTISTTVTQIKDEFASHEHVKGRQRVSRGNRSGVEVRTTFR